MIESMDRALPVRNGAVPDVRILGGRGRGGGRGLGGWACGGRGCEGETASRGEGRLGGCAYSNMAELPPRGGGGCAWDRHALLRVECLRGRGGSLPG